MTEDQPPRRAKAGPRPGGPIRSINIVELRNYTGRVFASVQSGETLRITKERRPAAILSPFKEDGGESELRTISIDELKTKIKEVIASVQSGETLRITKRSEPVAILSPIPGDTVEMLRATGIAVPAENPDIVYSELPSLVARHDVFAALERPGRNRP